MTPITIISDKSHAVDARVDGGRLLIPPDALPQAIGWTLKPEGLCQDDVCVPVRDRAALLVGDDLDLAAIAAVLGRQAVVDAEAGIAAIANDTETRRRALDGLEAPDFALGDLDGATHHLHEWRGTKKLLVAFASW